MAKLSKVFKIESHRYQNDSKSYQEGTLEELTKAYSYTLECGRSYQNEKGNAKINCNPKSVATLVKNLNNAVNNSASNGYAGITYSLVEGDCVVNNLELNEFSMPHFNILSCCNYPHKILRINELKLYFKNDSNKVIVLSFNDSDIKQFIHKEHYIDMSKLKDIPRDYKLFRVRRNVVTPSVFKNETESVDNVIINITKSVPKSIITRQYDEFIKSFTL
jgi:hypothetical protein